MSFKNQFQIANFIIKNGQVPMIVAEIGLNHNNNLEIGKRTIESAQKSGVHAVKFQSYITSEFIDSNNAESKFLFDIFKKYELSEQYHREFQKTAEDLGLIFFSTPLCNTSVDLLVNLKVKLIKIASGDIVNKQLLSEVAKTKLPIFLSSGAASLDEVTRTMEYLQELDVQEICLFHCVSMYPTPPEKLNLKTIQLYENMYNIPIGFSDHSSGSLGAVIATSYNVSVIEKHFTLDKTLDGPDHTISIDPMEMSELVKNVNLAVQMRGELKKIVQPEEKNGRFYGRRSLYKQNQKLYPLRPAMHTRDILALDSWDIELAKEILKNSQEGNVLKKK